VALAIAVAPITRAQQADDQTKQAIETMVAKWAQAVNKGDGETASSLFTPDAINIDVYGRTSSAQLGELTQKSARRGHQLDEQGR
jgi:ketosteroid isomerase-like protein